MHIEDVVYLGNQNDNGSLRGVKFKAILGRAGIYVPTHCCAMNGAPTGFGHWRKIKGDEWGTRHPTDRGHRSKVKNFMWGTRPERIKVRDRSKPYSIELCRCLHVDPCRESHSLLRNEWGTHRFVVGEGKSKAMSGAPGTRRVVVG